MKLPSLGTQSLLALLLGLVFGAVASESALLFVIPLGEAFLKLLQMLIIPLTVSTIVASIASHDNLVALKALSVRTLSWFLITAVFATLIAIAVGLLISPGLGDVNSIEQVVYSARVIPEFSDLFLDLIPGNLFVTFSQDNMLPAIIFSLLFGVALGLTTAHTSPLRTFFTDLSKVMFQLTRWVIRCSPIAVFALIAPVSAKYGLESVFSLGWFIFAIYLACFGQLIIYGVLVMVFARMSPWHFYSAIWPMMVMAFSTSSTMATLPVTMTTLTTRLKLPEKVVSFVAPLGATMKMDGCGAIFPVLVAIFTANIFGIPLGVEEYVLLSLTAVIATIGTAGVPGTASIMATVVLASVGLPLEGLALVIGIDKIVDVMRTTVNATGSAVCSVLVATREEKGQ